MAIKTNYNFKGIEVKDAYIRIDRLFGSSKEGWNSLVGVYNITTEEVPAVEEVTEQRLISEAIAEVIAEDGNVVTEAQEAVYETVIVTEAQEATTKTVFNKLEEFNFNIEYKEDERGYVSLYSGLKEKYSGLDC